MAKSIPKPSKPERPQKTKKRPTDPNALAHFLGDKLTEHAEAPQAEAPKVVDVTQDDIRRVMSALGQRGGKKGGKMRMETMTQKERSDIAFKAAKARWDKVRKP
jgi:hypothetical protein